MGSADVSAGDTILASQQADLRDDMIDIITAADEIFVSTTATAGTLRTAVTQALATAGTSTVIAGWSPLRVKHAVDALAPGLSSQIVTGTRTGAAGSGTQSVTGVGFQPTKITIIARESTPVLQGSIGFVDSDEAVINFQIRGAAGSFSTGGTAVVIDDGTANGWSATVGNFASDGFDIVWTENGTGQDITWQAICEK